MWRRSITFVNARVHADGGEAASLRFGTRILSLDGPPQAGDVVIDLDGAFVLPGLINAHDHLELNHYGRLKFQNRYANVSGWIDDMRPKLSEEPAIRAASGHAMAHRLFIGALKNLLAGVTTVAHHNPLYRELRRAFPIRVVRRYGWAHSFLLEHQPAGANGEPGGEVLARWRATPADAPFMVHLAEGVDDAARAEFAKLEARGCLAPNTVIIHGVAIQPDEWKRFATSGAGLVWCPSSNLFLFGQTADVLRFKKAGARGRVAIGTDSRLSGERDLLDELRTALAARPVSASQLLDMVTTSPAALLGLPGSGRIKVGHLADLLVIPPHGTDAASALLQTVRNDVVLVTVGGRPVVGDPSLAAGFRARRVPSRMIVVDETPKLADAALARRIARSPIGEPGVEVR